MSFRESHAAHPPPNNWFTAADPLLPEPELPERPAAAAAGLDPVSLTVVALTVPFEPLAPETTTRSPGRTAFLPTPTFLVTLVVLDNPIRGHYGGAVAAPVFRDVTSFALESLKIPPTGTTPVITALAACLKQHGVTLPARPPGARGGPPPGSGTTPRKGFFGRGGGFANNPKLRAAFQACGARFGFGGGQRFRLSRAAITKYVTCVRQHGYNLPTPNFSGKGPVFPSNIRGNTKFQAASRACQNRLVPPGGGTSTTSGA